jgi:hypothetical protein
VDFKFSLPYQKKKRKIKQQATKRADSRLGKRVTFAVSDIHSSQLGFAE